MRKNISTNSISFSENTFCSRGYPSGARKRYAATSSWRLVFFQSSRHALSLAGRARASNAAGGPARPQPLPSPARALIVDGTNVRMLALTDTGYGVSHVDAFTAWLSALRHLTACQHVFVVFDNKYGHGRHRGAFDVRATFAPAYLQKRRAKALGSQPPRTPQGSKARHDAACQGAGEQAASPQQQHTRHPHPHPHARSHRQPTRRLQQLALSAEALVDAPPPRLAAFAEAVRREGGLPLYGLPGFEADDMIASLVAGLLRGPPSAAGVEFIAAPASSSAAAGASREPAPARPRVASAADTACRPPAQLPPRDDPAGLPGLFDRVFVASSDRDMLQLLGHRRCTWLELRQLSRAAATQESPPLAVTACEVPGVSSALMLLHEAAAEAGGAAIYWGTGGEGGVGAPGASSSAPLVVATRESLLPPGRYPDYLALVGKGEAGVPGVGLSRRAARNLLLRYGSVEGVVRAYEAGVLDETLRPAVGAPRVAAGTTTTTTTTASAAASAAAAAVDGSVTFATNPEGISGGALVVPRGPAGPRSGGDAAARGEGRGEGGADGGVGRPQPPAVDRALRNLMVTRMFTEPGVVPWGRLRGYCRQRQEQQQRQVRQDEEQEQEEAQARVQGRKQQQQQTQLGCRTQDEGEGNPAVATWAYQGTFAHTITGLSQPPAPASPTLMVGPGRGPERCPAASLHPQDRLHLASAEPFARALADALLARRGVRLLRPHLDHQGHLADLVVLLAPGGQEEEEEQRGQQRQQEEEAEDELRGLYGSSGLQQERARAGEAPAEGVQQHEAGLVAPAAVEAVAWALAQLAAKVAGRPVHPTPSPSPSPSSAVAVAVAAGVEGARQGPAAGGEPQPASEQQGVPGSAVRVCVLAPWDFRDDSPQPGDQQQQGKQERSTLPRKEQAHQPKMAAAQAAEGADRAPEAPEAHAVAKGGPSGSPVEGDGGPGDTTAAALRCLARSLRSVVGPRQSLVHVPRTLQAALRHTSAWRLKRLQRSVGEGGAVAVVPFYELMSGPGPLEEAGSEGVV